MWVLSGTKTQSSVEGIGRDVIAAISARTIWLNLVMEETGYSRLRGRRCEAIIDVLVEVQVVGVVAEGILD